MKKIFRTIFGLFSLTGIMFTFQACYGTPQDFGLDVAISGKVQSAATKTGVPDIRVEITGLGGQYITTEQDGNFFLYVERADQYQIKVEDVDGELNGSFQPLDTLITCPDDQSYLDVVLELK